SSTLRAGSDSRPPAAGGRGRGRSGHGAGDDVHPRVAGFVVVDDDLVRGRRVLLLVDQARPGAGPVEGPAGDLPVALVDREVVPLELALLDAHAGEEGAQSGV